MVHQLLTLEVQHKSSRQRKGEKKICRSSERAKIESRTSSGGSSVDIIEVKVDTSGDSGLWVIIITVVDQECRAAAVSAC